MTASIETVCACLMEWREGEPSGALEIVTGAMLRSVRRRMERMSRAELRVMTALVRVMHETMLERGASKGLVALAWTTATLGSERQRAQQTT